MFGIGGGEIMLILFIVLMLFGSDKVPEMARTLAKVMAQLKNATNDIKSEIQKSAQENGYDQSLRDITNKFTDISSGINSEIDKAKQNLLADTTTKEITKKITAISSSFEVELNQTKETILSEPTAIVETTVVSATASTTITSPESEETSGPIKRQN